MNIQSFFESLITKARARFGIVKAEQIKANAIKLAPLNAQKRVEYVSSQFGEPIAAVPSKSFAKAAPVRSATPSTSAGEVSALRQKIADLEKQLAAVTAQNEMAIATKALEIACTQGNVPPISFGVRQGASGDVLQEANAIGNPVGRAIFIRDNQQRIAAAYDQERKSALAAVTN